MLYKIILFFILGIVINVNPVQAEQQADLASYPLVLEYHQIAPVAKQAIDVSVENFQKEMD